MRRAQGVVADPHRHVCVGEEEEEEGEEEEETEVVESLAIDIGDEVTFCLQDVGDHLAKTRGWRGALKRRAIIIWADIHWCHLVAVAVCYMTALYALWLWVG